MKAVWITPSVSAAPLRKAARSVSSPRNTAAPVAATAFADSSERARPSTLCPAPSNSWTTAEPMNPDAPVTNTRMVLSFF